MATIISPEERVLHYRERPVLIYSAYCMREGSSDIGPRADHSCLVRLPRKYSQEYVTMFTALFEHVRCVHSDISIMVTVYLTRGSHTQ